MRKVLMVEFEHEEKKPDGFNAALGEFLRHVLTVGYRVHGKWVHDHGPTAQPKVEAPTVTSAEPVEAEIVALAVETATAVDGPDDVVKPKKAAKPKAKKAKK
jgi:hypothetical protein